MNLEQLTQRLKEIEDAIVSTTNQLHSLAGHKSETQHWISLIETKKEEIQSEVEQSVEAVLE